MELRGRDFLEPMFMLALQGDYLPTIGRVATALEGQIMIENSGEVDCDFFTSIDLADGLDSI